MTPEHALLRRSLLVNSVLLTAIALAALLIALRAEHFSDLAYTSMMIYVTAGFFFVNLGIAAVQAWRRQEWLTHTMVAIASVLLGGLLLFLGLLFV